MGAYGTLFSQRTLNYALLIAVAIIILLSATLIVLAPTEVDLLAIGVAFVALLNFIFHKQSPSIFLGLLAILLIGYMFLGRGFAHLGISPLYVGELVLFIGLLTMISRRGYLVPLRSGLVWIYLAFAALGLARTLPYIETYGLDALRDDALWYYGAFMLLTAWLFNSRKQLELGIRWFSKIMPTFLLWIPIAYISYEGFRFVIPRVPGGDEALLLTFNPGDVGILLGASFIFLLLFQDKWSGIQSRWPTLLLWTLGIGDFFLIAATGRGAMLAIVAGVMLTLMIRPSSRIWQAALVGLVILLIFSAVEISLPTAYREVSASRLQDNFSSITGGDIEDERLNNTKEWRLEFWSDITENVVSGPYFWTGQGFGINLADYYGYQVLADGSLRNPHNTSMTILARMGVPGLALWILFNLAYAFSLLRAIILARRSGSKFWESLNLLLLAYWLMATINTSFSPSLEGPQGAIWFWAVTGVGIAALQVQRREMRANIRGQIVSSEPTVALSSSPRTG